MFPQPSVRVLLGRRGLLSPSLGSLHVARECATRACPLTPLLRKLAQQSSVATARPICSACARALAASDPTAPSAGLSRPLRVLRVQLYGHGSSSQTQLLSRDDLQYGRPSCLLMQSSSFLPVAESRRGLDFIFDINRLNVAVSRAQALAIIVSNEGLQQCQVSNLRQMEKVGFYLKLIK